MLDAQLAVGVVGGVRVAGGVERGGLGGGKVQPGRAQVRLELADRAGAESPALLEMPERTSVGRPSRRLTGNPPAPA